MKTRNKLFIHGFFIYKKLTILSLFWSFFFLAISSLSAQSPKVENAIPNFKHIRYSDEKPFNILNIYIPENIKDKQLTPLYIYAHTNGRTLDDITTAQWNILSSAGIALVSWESIVNIRTTEDSEQCMNDLLKVMDFVFANAEKYNFDTNKIVMGGGSRGSFISWRYPHQNPHIIKGIYSTGALGDPLMWKESQTDLRNDIHIGSPPLFFAYRTTLGDCDIHNPKSGFLVKERYEKLGIGDRARIEHSLTKRGLIEWSFLAEFILKVTADPFSHTGKRNNSLETVKIGEQVWMQNNLNVSTFRNGDIIPEVRNAEEWSEYGAKGMAAWCYYNNDPKNGETFGKLYNWYAVNDPRQIAPEGFSIPTTKDMNELYSFLGGINEAGNMLKSKTGWANIGYGTNESGFNGVPGGNRNADGTFYFINEYAYWWTATATSIRNSNHFSVNYYSNEVLVGPCYGLCGFSVRCIKN